MKTLTSLTLAISVLAILRTAVIMLAPDKYRREMKGIISLIIVITVGSIITGMDFSFDGLNADKPGYNLSLNAHDRLLQDELEGRIEEYIGNFLNEEGIECKKIEVTTNIDDARCIFITEASLTLDERYRENEPYITSLIEDKIGKIGIKIFYGDG